MASKAPNCGVSSMIQDVHEYRVHKGPVRGFTTIAGAMAWAMRVGRTAILKYNAPQAHKLPDHHNKFRDAWWNDGDIAEWKCVYSANK